MREKILLRSFMFLSAYNRKFIDKALSSEADALILDLEDSVPPLQRQGARENIIEYAARGAFQGRNIFIRVNELGSKDFAEDILRVSINGITGFMPSKINDAEDIIFIDKLLETMELKNDIEIGTFKLAPLIETASAVMNINEIAKASKRLVALCFGGEDYLNDIGSTYTYQESAFIVPRSMLVNAARANGLLPIDTPYLNIADIKGFVKKETEAYKNGFAGCLLLNPKQIDVANKVFSPNDRAVEYSKRVIEAVKLAKEENQTGVAMLDGIMVGPPMRKRAETVLGQYQLRNGKMDY